MLGLALFILPVYPVESLANNWIIIINPAQSLPRRNVCFNLACYILQIVGVVGGCWNGWWWVVVGVVGKGGWWWVGQRPLVTFHPVCSCLVS